MQRKGFFLKSSVFGHTSTGLPIISYNFGGTGSRVLLIAGVHGDEPEGIVLAHSLLSLFANSFSFKLQIDIIPLLNIDGILTKNRLNSNGVDLNRNFPTNDWAPEFEDDRYNPGPAPASEPETKTLIDYIESKRPSLVISLHSPNPLLNINGRCKRIAETIAQFNHYAIKEHIGYPTPGCLGTYCGLERDIPTLNFEIKNESSNKTVTNTHLKALIEGLKVAEKRIH